MGGSAECAGACLCFAEFDRIWLEVSHALHPLGGGGFNRYAHSAEPTPKVCESVHWLAWTMLKLSKHMLRALSSGMQVPNIEVE